MGTFAKVASSVMQVSELDRSIGFYRDVFSCVVEIREPDAALLLTPDGFQIYMYTRTSSTYRGVDDLGVQYIMWAVDSEEELQRVTERLCGHDPAIYIHTLNEVCFVDGRDPDGIRVIIAFPSPAQLPRELIDPRFH